MRYCVVDGHAAVPIVSPSALHASPSTSRFARPNWNFIIIIVIIYLLPQIKIHKININLGEEKKKKKKPQDENIYGLPCYIGRP